MANFKDPIHHRRAWACGKQTNLINSRRSLPVKDIKVKMQGS